MAMTLMRNGVPVPTVDFQVSDWSDLDPHFTAICSEATLQSDRRGFFLDIAEQVRAMLHNVQPVYRTKCAETAARRLADGEHALRTGNARAALSAFNQAVMRAPCEPQPHQVFVRALWARSDALQQLRHFHLSITDVMLSTKSGLPEEQRHEAFVRIAQCQHALGETLKARGSLQVAARLALRLPDAPLRASWTASIQQALAAISPTEEPRQPQTAGPPEPAPEPPLAGGAHPNMPTASALLRVAHTPGAGRHMEAAAPIGSGDILAVEAPEAACLLPDKFGTHCLHCFSRLVAPLPCPTCSGVAFCGPACRQSGVSGYHRFECRHQGLLLGSGMSVLCHLALRMLTQRAGAAGGIAFFRDLQPYGPRQAEAIRSEEQRGYLKVFGLETHSDKRSAKDFMHRTIMALFLTRILQESGFFLQASPDKDDKLNADELLAAALLLHHLQLLQFNAHEVYETVMSPKQGEQVQAQRRSKFRSARVGYIGVAIYPTVALFNHDCYPAVTRYFRGRDIVLGAVRPLEAGEVVSENYGPIFTKRSLAQRQRSLSSRYWFRCSCMACAEDWPLMAELEDDIRKLRCPTPGCPQLLSAPHAAEGMASAACPKCQRPVPLADLQSRVETCGRDLDAALDAMERDAPEEAVPLLRGYLDAMHRLTRPPLRSIHLAQEALRTCLADGGNVWAPGALGL